MTNLIRQAITFANKPENNGAAYHLQVRTTHTSNIFTVLVDTFPDIDDILLRDEDDNLPIFFNPDHVIWVGIVWLA